MKRYCKYICLIVLIWCSACSDFLEEYSQDLTYAKTAADLDEILVGEGYMSISPINSFLGLDNTSYYFPWLHLMDDDVDQYAQWYIIDMKQNFKAFYSWAPYPYTDVNGDIVKDNTWERLYKHISVVNVLLKKSEEINDFPEEIERIQGECHFLRAVYYYYLVNFYAKPYTKATAGTDLGVTIKTSEYIEDKYFSRNTVAEVYEQILADLNEAKRLLKGKAKKTVYRANYYAAHALLSRVYLYMEEYDQAVAAADSVLMANYEVLDFNSLTPSTDEWGDPVPTYSAYKDSPETIFSQGGNAIGVMMSDNQEYYRVSDDFVEFLGKDGNDLRNRFCLIAYDYGVKFEIQAKLSSTNTGLVSSNCLIRLPEVILNKAEALALSGKDDEARRALEMLREKRYATGTHVAVSHAGDALIDFIRDERRRELCFEGHRWFDLRRYAVNSRRSFTTEILHDEYEYNPGTYAMDYKGTYRLKPYDEAPASYVLPIPMHVIEFNRGEIKANDERPEVEMIVKDK